jgi:kumamolisin
MRGILRAILLASVASVLLLGSLAPVASAIPNGESNHGSSEMPPAAALSSPNFASTSLGFDATALSELSSPRPLSSAAPITLGITLLPRQGDSLANLAISAATPGNPDYGHFLNASSFDELYAPTPGEYSTVEKTLESAGFSLGDVYSDRMFLMATGSAMDAEKLFSTTLTAGSLEGRQVVLPATQPVLPSAIAPYVLTVTGLTENIATFDFDSTPLQIPSPSAIGFTDPHFMYGLDDLYNLSGGPHYATGMNIGLLLWGEGYNPQDLSTFGQQYYPSTEPAFHIDPVPLDGAQAPSAAAVTDPSGSAFELTLDMEWSESQAPGATLIPAYVPDGPAPGYSPSDADLEDGLAYLVNSSGANVISMSFGTTDGPDQPFQITFNQLLEIAAAEGVSVFASSGDNGGAGQSSGTCTSTPRVEFPATSPWVTAVGGTAPALDLSLTEFTTGGISSEPAWGNSGGGFSPTYQAPSWQLTGSAGTVIASIGNGMRGVPDVSGPAADNYLYYNSSEQTGSGTSFASPMWAGIAAEMTALRGHGLGLLTPALYRMGTMQDDGATPLPYRDTTEGSNCLYSAQRGWDPVTGWGTPYDVVTLYGDMIQGLLTLKLSFNPSPALPGFSEKVTVTARNGSQPAADLPIHIIFYSVPLILLRASVIAWGTFTTDSSGKGQVSFIVPFYYPDNQMLVKAEGYSTLGVGTVTATVGVSLAGAYWGPLEPLLTYPYNIPFFLLLMGVATVVGWAIGRERPVKRPVPVRMPVRQPVRAPARAPARTPQRPVSKAGPTAARPVPRAAPARVAPTQASRTPQTRQPKAPAAFVGPVMVESKPVVEPVPAVEQPPEEPVVSPEVQEAVAAQPEAVAEQPEFAAVQPEVVAEQPQAVPEQPEVVAEQQYEQPVAPAAEEVPQEAVAVPQEEAAPASEVPVAPPAAEPQPEETQPPTPQSPAEEAEEETPAPRRVPPKKKLTLKRQPKKPKTPQKKS